MQKFIYKARMAGGMPASGVIEARDERGAVNLLRKRKMVVIDLKPKREGFELPFVGKSLTRVGHKELTGFTRQLSTMITAGLSLTDSLSILENQTEKAMSSIVGQVVRDIEGGSTLASAMEKQPQVFSKVYVSLVKVGESAGVLDKVLKRMAITLEKQQEFRGKVKGALIYPTIVTVGMIVVGFVMMIFVIPKLTTMYQDFGADLPGPTLVLISVAQFTGKFWYVFLVLLILAIFGFLSWVKTARGRLRFDLLMLKIMIVGPLRTNVILTEFTRTLGLLVGAGIPLLEALEIVQNTLGSAVYENSIALASKSVEKGFPLAGSLAKDQHFPPIVAQMVSVGEETGKLEDVLKRLSRYFEVEASQRIKALTTSIEPLIMIVLGVGVGFLVIAVILPIYNLADQF